jgi:hypothetical protein
MQIIMRKQLYLREKGSRRSNEEILSTSLCDASEKIRKNNSRIKIQMFLVICSAMCLATTCPTYI